MEVLRQSTHSQDFGMVAKAPSRLNRRKNKSFIWKEPDMGCTEKEETTESKKNKKTFDNATEQSVQPALIQVIRSSSSVEDNITNVEVLFKREPSSDRVKSTWPTSFEKSKSDNIKTKKTAHQDLIAVTRSHRRYRCQEPISDMLRVKRIIGRMHFTQSVKMEKIANLEKTAQEAENQLRMAELLLQRDGKKFDAFLKKYMKGNKERDDEEKAARKEFQNLRRELDGKIRDMKLRISSMEQNIFQLEDKLKDQNQIKMLLARNSNRKIQHGAMKSKPQDESNPSNSGVSRDHKTSEDQKSAGKKKCEKKVEETIPNDVLDFAVDIMGFEDRNFNLMKEIQDKEIRLRELQRHLKQKKRN